MAMIRKETVIKRSERLSAKRKKLVKEMANSADAKAPIIMRELSWRSIPRRIKEPSPPAPIRAASRTDNHNGGCTHTGHNDGHG